VSDPISPVLQYLTWGTKLSAAAHRWQGHVSDPISPVPQYLTWGTKVSNALVIPNARLLTYADVCRRMLTGAFNGTRSRCCTRRSSGRWLIP
jgi:hypothetical protein